MKSEINNHDHVKCLQLNLTTMLLSFKQKLLLSTS